MERANKATIVEGLVAPIEVFIPAQVSKDAGQRRPNTGYIKTLDGWRTIAVFGVVLYHARPISVGPIKLENLQDFGDRGVQLFFAISGILICSRLLEEQRMHGRISVSVERWPS